MNCIYLIASDSIRLIEEELYKIVKDNNYISYDLNISNLEDVMEECSYMSLFDEKKYIVLKNASIFGASRKKSDTAEEKTSKKDDILIRYMQDPNVNNVLIFTYNGKPDSKKKIFKNIKDNYNYIEVGNLKPKDIEDKIKELFKKDGYKIDSNTVHYIVFNALNNYDLAYNEVSKIKLYYNNPCEVKLDDVQNIISRTIEDSNFKFIDAVIGKNIKDSFRIYDDLMLQKVEPIMLLSMISKEIRNTLLVKKLMMTRSKRDMMSVLGINYDFQIDKLINNSYSYKEKELEDYLVYLCDLDYRIKRGKISNKLALEMFIMKICQ